MGKNRLHMQNGFDNTLGVVDLAEIRREAGLET